MSHQGVRAGSPQFGLPKEYWVNSSFSQSSLWSWRQLVLGIAPWLCAQHSTPSALIPVGLKGDAAFLPPQLCPPWSCCPVPGEGG